MRDFVEKERAKDRKGGVAKGKGRAKK